MACVVVSNFEKQLFFKSKENRCALKGWKDKQQMLIVSSVLCLVPYAILPLHASKPCMLPALLTLQLVLSCPQPPALQHLLMRCPLSSFTCNSVHIALKVALQRLASVRLCLPPSQFSEWRITHTASNPKHICFCQAIQREWLLLPTRFQAKFNIQ